MNCIPLPSSLKGFSNTNTAIVKTVSERELYLIEGVPQEREITTCPFCGQPLHVHGSTEGSLSHLIFWHTLSLIRFEKKRYYCPSCRNTSMQGIAFQSDSHRITRATDNKHFSWFANLLENHFEEIIAHAAFNVSTGKIEGVNSKIKTVRQQAYGYPDDDYFFLKIYDASRRSYVQKPKSHRIYD